MTDKPLAVITGMDPAYVENQIRRQSLQRDYDRYLKDREEIYQAKLATPGKIGFAMNPLRRKNGSIINKHRNLNRNDLCLCGSGLKIKKCPCNKTKGYE